MHCQQWPFPEFFVLAEKVKIAHHYWYQQSAQQPHQLGLAFEAEVAVNYYCYTRPYHQYLAIEQCLLHAEVKLQKGKKTWMQSLCKEV